MKKLLICLLTLILVFTATACSFQGGGDKPEPTTKEYSVVHVNGKNIKLNYKTDLNKMHYMVSLSEFYSDQLGFMNIVQYSKQYADGPVTYFDMRMRCYQKQNLAETTKEVDFELSPKTINGIEYQYGETTFHDENSNNDYEAHQYFYEFEGDTYSLYLILGREPGNFEEAFMENVYFQ